MKKLVVIHTISTLGVAITWTGLPVYALNLTSSYIFTGALYFTGTIASIIATLIGGHIVDRFSKKNVILVSFLFNFLVLTLLFFVISNNLFWLLFPIMIFSQSLGALSNLSLDVWYNSYSKNENLSMSIGRKNSWVMTAKTVGFTLGPLIYNLIEAFAILINSFSFLLCAVIVFKTKYKKTKIEQIKKLNLLLILQGVLSKKPFKIYLLTSLLEGMIGPIIISFSIYILNENLDASSNIISAFWFIGGIGAIASNYCLSKFNIYKSSKVKLFILSCVFITGGISIMTFSQHWSEYLSGFLLMTFGNPIVSNLLRSEIYIHAGDDMKGKTTGVMQASTQVGTLIFMSLSWIIFENFGVRVLLILIALISLFRIIMFFKTYQVKTINSFTAIKDQSL